MVSLIVTVLTCVLALASTAQAQFYRFRTVDAPCPGCTRTIVTGVTPQGTVLGLYTDTESHTHGFLWPARGDFTPLPLLEPQAINLAGALAGSQGRVGFLFQEGTLHRIEVQGVLEADIATSTTVEGLNDLGQVVGTFRSPFDHHMRGFLYDAATHVYTVIAVPDALHTELLALDNQGRLLGHRHDQYGTRRSFLWEAGTFTFLNLPNRPGAHFVGLTNGGLLAGNWAGTGFVFDGTTVDVIAVPSARSTFLEGIREDGTVYGFWSDGTSAFHGFLATPVGTRLRPRPFVHLR